MHLNQRPGVSSSFFCETISCRFPTLTNNGGDCILVCVYVIVSSLSIVTHYPLTHSHRQALMACLAIISWLLSSDVVLTSFSFLPLGMNIYSTD